MSMFESKLDGTEPSEAFCVPDPHPLCAAGRRIEVRDDRVG